MKRVTFRELYGRERAKDKAAESHRRLFIKRVAELTRKSENTVKAWVAGTQRPGELEAALIADSFGVEMDGLFPESVKYKRPAKTKEQEQ